MAKHDGARHVVITGLNPYRLELAERLVATVALDVRSGNTEQAVAAFEAVRTQLG